MAQQSDIDPIETIAWAWVQREHDQGNFHQADRTEMAKWLLADPVHRKAYDRAARLWLIAALVPPAHDLGEQPGLEPEPGADAGR